MNGQRRGLQVSRSIAGTFLIAVGMFLLYGDLVGALARFTHPSGAAGLQGLGMLPATILAVGQILQTYAAGRQHFLREFIHGLLLSCWPLLLVVLGTALSSDAFADEAQRAAVEKDYACVDLLAAHSTHKQGPDGLTFHQER